MKKYMIYCIFVLFGFTIFGCGKENKETQPNEQSPVKVSEYRNELDKEDILSAFRFWVNKKAWLYGDCEYVDTNMDVDLYYRQTEDNRYLGYLYIINKSDYTEISFILGKDGYVSKPSSIGNRNSIENDLIYLGREEFYFDSADISKPEYSALSKEKEEFIKKAEQAIREALLKRKRKAGYQVFILDFTNEDVAADVIIIEDNKEMSLCKVLNQIKLDDGTILRDIAEFVGSRDSVVDWTDDQNRMDYEKELQLAVHTFTVDVKANSDR